MHRQISRLLAFENAIHIAGCAPILVDVITPIRDEAPGGDEVARVVDRRQFVLGRKCDDQIATSLYNTA